MKRTALAMIAALGVSVGCGGGGGGGGGGEIGGGDPGLGESIPGGGNSTPGDSGSRDPVSKFGRCVKFDGSQFAHTAGDVAEFDFGKAPFTIEMWVQPIQAPAAGRYASLLSKGQSYKVILLDDLKIVFIRTVTTVVDGQTVTAQRRMVTTYPVLTGQWYYIMIARAAKSNRWYLRVVSETPSKLAEPTIEDDGGSLFLSPSLNNDPYENLVDTSAPLLVGGERTRLSDVMGLVGFMDDVRINKDYVSSTTVPVRGSARPGTNTLALWRFEEASDAILFEDALGRNPLYSYNGARTTDAE